MASPADLVPLLEADLDTHLVTLKFLTLFGDRCEVRLDRRDEGWAAAVLMPADLFAWDRRVYPGVGSIVFLAGTSRQGLDRTVAALPGTDLVVKTADPLAQDVLRLRGRDSCRSFLWYETGVPAPPGRFPVIEGAAADPVLRRLLEAHAFSAAELDAWFAQGARGHWAGPPDEPRAFCFTYPNFGRVWEVGSVRTFDPWKGRGWGSAVVSAAVNSLLDRGLRVRYHVESTNTASRALAASLGLTCQVETKHYRF